MLYSNLIKNLRNKKTLLLSSNYIVTPLFKYRSITTTTSAGVSLSFVPFFITILLVPFCLYAFPDLGNQAAQAGSQSANSSNLDLATLKEMLSEVDLFRRSLMHNFNQATEFALANLNLINNCYDSFVQANPHLQNHLDLVRKTLEIVSNSNHTGNIESEAQYFQDTIAPLDVASTQLNEMIHSLDPTWESDSDTDQDMIGKAADEMAKRAHSGNSGGTAGSPTK